jgi:formamidopyrimidine-DNA glycosylase
LPELPEVETTMRGIKPWLTNQEICTVNVFNAALRWPIPGEVNDLVGEEVVHVFRRAKYILIQLSNQAHLIMHLGMSGVIRVVDADSTYQKHDHFEMVLSDGKALRLNDPRRFGCVLLSNDAIAKHRLLVDLGPEPLSAEFNGRWLKQKANNKTVAIKNFIMNNHVVVGVGNIYAAESLFLSGIKPTKKVGLLGLKQLNNLAETIKTVLSKAIIAGGTTLNDFRNSDGKPGYFKQQLHVYGRDGLPCLSCGSVIKNIKIGQRASCYCPTCQI